MSVVTTTQPHPQSIPIVGLQPQCVRLDSLAIVVERYLRASGSGDCELNQSVALSITERTNCLCCEQDDQTRTALRLAADEIAKMRNIDVIPVQQFTKMQPARAVRSAAPLRLSWWTGLLQLRAFTAPASAGPR